MALPAEGIREFTCLDLRWRLDLSSVITRSMIANGIWERDTTQVVLEYAKPGMQVLSVGANFGYYAMLMARQVGPTGHVWAFEPTRHWREQLDWHIQANGFGDRITVVPLGLSDHAGRHDIVLTPQSASMHYWPEIKTLGSESIELKPLDELAAGLGIKNIGFISMDIDGHEAAFLRGARQILSRERPPIAMEFAQRCLHYAGSDVREVARLLDEMGYVICGEDTRKPFGTEMDFLRQCGNFSTDSNALALPK